MTSKEKQEKLERGKEAYSAIRKEYGTFFKRVVVEDYDLEPRWGGDLHHGRMNYSRKKKGS